MKWCSQCNREIPDSATTCGQCDSLGALDLPTEAVWQAEPAAMASVAAAPVAPVAPAVPTAPTAPPASAATVAAKSAGISNRRMLLAGLLVVAGGTLTFAMFRSSTAPATPVTSAPTKSAASKTNAPRPAAAHTVVTVSKWTAANRDWLLNAKKGAAFEVRSDNKVAIWQAIAQPVLVVRCEAGKMQTFVYTASAIQMEAQDENHSVGVSFDGEPEVSERWADSAEHDALFAPDSVEFAHRLSTSQTLRVSYRPHNAPRAVATFQVAGLSETLQPAAKQCGWK
jgi:hypothetical protein